MTRVYPFDHGLDLPLDEVKMLLGGKAANIGVMVRDLGLPVPPGLVITTDACREYLAGGWPEGLDAEIAEHLAAVEQQVGRRFGDPADPLLVSVRSGAPISMPGMMDTVLNLGLNADTLPGLAASGGPVFAEACRERLVESYRDIVGTALPEDPWQQLRGAVEAVFRSWNGARARAYRAHEGIPDDLGTAVIVQAMVFGNLGHDSGTGVIFTRNPATGENAIYGDVLFEAQGEDVVAGTHETEAFAVLDERMPEVAAEVRDYAARIERHTADCNDIEFTIERGRLWMLQTRIGKRSPQAALRMAVEMALDETFPLTREEAVRRVARYLADPPTAATDWTGSAAPLTTALGASPGLAAGEVATSADMAVAMAEEGRTVLLVRPETSPDDVHGMARAAGILTSTGGLASHAAVVARGWGIPAVVGAAAVEVGDGEIRIGGRRFGGGDSLTIDGSAGHVYEGALVGSAEVVPEAAVLLEWAAELGIDVRPEGEGSTDDMSASIPEEGPTADALLRAMVVKAFAMPDGLAPMVMATAEGLEPLLAEFVESGLAETVGPMYRLTAAGKERGGALIAADREAWGVANAEAALDGFLPLDGRMKQVVTAWQMREVGGAPVMNDHSDAGYDAAVLADFASLAADAGEWLAPLAGGLARLDTYVRRLDAAAARVAGGEHEYVASPRLDSYHNVWFELHEDLILLAGRTREDEVAAGRA